MGWGGRSSVSAQVRERRRRLVLHPPEDSEDEEDLVPVPRVPAQRPRVEEVLDSPAPVSLSRRRPGCVVGGDGAVRVPGGVGVPVGGGGAGRRSRRRDRSRTDSGTVPSPRCRRPFGPLRPVLSSTSRDPPRPRWTRVFHILLSRPQLTGVTVRTPRHPSPTLFSCLRPWDVPGSSPALWSNRSPTRRYPRLVPLGPLDGASPTRTCDPDPDPDVPLFGVSRSPVDSPSRPASPPDALTTFPDLRPYRDARSFRSLPECVHSCPPVSRAHGQTGRTVRTFL